MQSNRTLDVWCEPTKLEKKTYNSELLADDMQWESSGNSHHDDKRLQQMVRVSLPMRERGTVFWLTHLEISDREIIPMNLGLAPRRCAEVGSCIATKFSQLVWRVLRGESVYAECENDVAKGVVCRRR